MSIILSSIKRGLRDKGTIISNLFLVLMLPYVFSIMFSTILSNDSVAENLNLRIIGNKNSTVVESYIDTLKKFDKESNNINLTYKIYDKNEFKEDENSETNNLTVVIDEKNREISLAGNKILSMGERVISSITEEFFSTISLYEYISKEGSSPVISNNLIKTTEYEIGSSSNVMFDDDTDYGQYFSIVMLQMAVLVSSIYAFKNTFYIKENIGNRVKSSPKKISNLLSLELAGSFILIFGQSIFMLGAISVIYGVKLNLSNIIPVLSLLGVLSVFAVCLGILTSAIAKKRTSGENICSMIVTVMVIGSGQLMPQFMGDIDKISWVKLNPFVSITNELNLLLNSNISENLYGTLGIGIIDSIILMIISTIIIKRKVVN